MPDLINLEDQSWYKNLGMKPAAVEGGEVVDLDNPTWYTGLQQGGPGAPMPDPVQPLANPDFDKVPLQPKITPGEFYGPRTLGVRQDISEKVAALDDLGAHFMSFRGKDMDADAQEATAEKFGKIRDVLDKNGVRSSISDDTIRKQALERLSTELGPMWADVVNEADTNRIVGAAVLAETIANSGLNSVEGVDNYAAESWVYQQVSGGIRNPGVLGEMAPEQFAQDCMTLEMLQGGTKAGLVLDRLFSPTAARRSMGVLDKYYEALTGHKPDGVHLDHKLEAVKPFQVAIARNRNKARTAEKYRRAGFDVTPDEIDNNGRIPLTALGIADESLNRFNVLLANGVSYTDPQKMANHRALNRMKDGIAKDPTQFLREVLPNFDESDTRFQAFAKELESEQDTQLRWRKYGRMMEGIREDYRIRQEKGIDWTKEANRQVHGETADVDWYITAAAPGHDALFEKYYNEELIGHDARLQDAQRLTMHLNHRDLNRQTTDATIRQRNQLKQKEDVRRKVEEHSWSVKLMNAIPHSIGAVSQFIGIGEIDNLISPINHYLVDQVFSPDPVSGVVPAEHLATATTDQLFKKRYQTLGQAFQDNFWFGRVDDRAYENFIARSEAGQSNWWTLDGIADRISVTSFAVWDMFSDLPGMAVDNPAQAATMMYLAGKVAKGRSKIVKAMVDKGVPRPLVAGAQALLEPERMMDNLSILMGTNSRQLKHFGTDARRLRREMLRHPEQAEAMLALNDKLLRDMEANPIPGLAIDNIRTYRAGVAAIWARAKKGQTVSLTDVDKVMTMGRKLPASIARPGFVPTRMVGPEAIKNAEVAAWEMENAIRDVYNYEQTLLRGDKDLADKLDKPVTHYYVDAHNARNAGRLAQWTTNFANHLGAKLNIAPEKIKDITDTLHRKIDRTKAIGTVSENFADAAIAWREIHHKALDLTNSLDIGAAAQRLDLDYLRSELDLVSRKVDKYFKIPKDQFTEAHAAKLTDLLEQDTKLKAQIKDTEVLVSKVDTTLTDMGLKVKQQLVRGSGQEGIEVGHRTPLNKAERMKLAEPLVDLVLQYGAKADQHGVPQGIIDAVDTAMGKMTQAQKQLKAWKLQRNRLLSKAPKIDFEKIRELDQKISQQGDFMRNTAVEHAGRAQHWNIPGLDEVHRVEVQGTRGLIQNWYRDLSTEAGPAYGLLDTLRLTRHPLATNQAGAVITSKAEAPGSIHHNVVHKLNEIYDELPRSKQRLHDRYWQDPQSLSKAELDQLNTELVLNEKSVRHMIIDEAQRLGRVTPEKAAQMKSTAWSERYYVEYEFGKELRDAGFETDMPSGKTSQAQTARYQRLRARRSTSEVRQFYTDPKTGKPVELSGEFTLKKYGTPQNALKAARDWAKTEIAEGRLTKQHIKEPLPIITDVEMGGLGLINSTGVFRFGELRRLINDNIKSQIFNTYAQMGEMARLTKADIPLNRHGEWTAEPLRGREWGALEGRYVHKKLLRHMNSWDQFNHVMEGVFQSMIEQVGQTMDITKLKHLKEGKPGGPISKVMRSWKHTLIVGRIGSWISNHVSNLHSAVIMGVNPLSRRYWEGYTEYGRIADAVANGDMTALTKAEAADFKYMHDNGLLGATVGTPSAGLAGKVAGTGLFRLDKVLKKTRKHHQAQMNKQLRRVELVERSIARIDDFLDAHNNNVRRLKKGELEKLTKQRERFSGLLKHEQRKIPKLMTKHPMLQMVEAGVKDTFRAMLDSERSILAQHFASHYSNIDPAHKYTMFKALRSKGWSRAAALQEVSDFTQNYNFVPPAVRRLKEYSLSSPLGAFTPSFPWEAGRIMKNMIRKTPGKALTYMAAIPAFNIGMLASHGLSYNDIKQMYGFESDHEALTAFMSNVYVPTDTGLEAVNMNKYGYLGSFTQSGGAMSPIIDRVAIPTIENNMGAVPAMALGAGLNYASQFVANNPLTNWLSSRFLGVDPYTKELTLGTNQNLGKWAWDSVAELGKLSLPGSYAALEQSMGKVDAPSVVTGHRRTMLQGFISGALGINWSSWKRSEAIGRMAMSYARPEQLDPFLRDMMTDERRELTSKVRHARQALDQGDTEKYQQYFDEAAAIMEEQEKDKGKFIAGKWQSTTKTRMAIEKKLTEHIGRNVFQFIEGTSIDRLPRFAHDAWTSGWVGKDSAEMQHIWRQMQDMDYLSNSGNSQQLERALTDIAMYSARTSDPELRANMDKASMTVAVQWLKTMLAEEKAKSPEQLIRDLLAGKKGAELRALQRVWQAARP